MGLQTLTSVLLVCTALIFFADVVNGAGDCSSGTACDACLGISGCGWCGAVGQCMAGQSFMGVVMQPAGCASDWVMLSAMCSLVVDNCPQYSTCEQCFANPSEMCGWCASTNACMKASGVGPKTGSCAEWLINSESCGKPLCSSYSSCATCISDVYCGWCTDGTGRCARGLTEPSVGTCTSDFLKMYNTCPANTTADPCVGLTTCAKCAANKKCGWCEATNSCMQGATTTAPSTCMGVWRKKASTCDVCPTLTTCAKCAANSKCGWCDGACVKGTTAGPTTGTCTSWTKSKSKCDVCAPLTTCAKCAANSQCGWCDTTSTCMKGTNKGPSTGTCDAWSWTRSKTKCPDLCPPLAASCTKCTAKSLCGWCDDTRSCTKANPKGTAPSAGTCTTWKKKSNTCDVCPTLTTCAKCAANSKCGWCDGACVKGTTAGPTTGTCTSWTKSKTKCGASAGNDTVCSPNTDCGSCAADAAQGCTWCATEKKCYKGTPMTVMGFTVVIPPDSVKTCKKWASDAMTCSLYENNCGNYTTCSECTAGIIPTCGWCRASSKCMKLSFETMGPANATCDDWLPFHGMCSVPRCDVETTCNGCIKPYLYNSTTANTTVDTNHTTPSYNFTNFNFTAIWEKINITTNLCGWCADSNTCVGGLTKPFSGTCITFKKMFVDKC